MRLSKAQFFAIFFFIVLLFLAIQPFITPGAATSEDLGFAIVLFCIGLTYLLSIFVPVWKKAALMSDGVVIILTSLFLFTDIKSIAFFIFGFVILFLAILAYLRRLPPKILDYFY